ncbi:MAG: antitoxin Xre/MbcA/ParS toxin-binding domain-containing protein [Cyclobacteriaceae bacterium]
MRNKTYDSKITSNVLNDPAVRYNKAHNGLSKSEFLSIVSESGLNLTEFSALLPVSKRTIEKVKDKELLSPQVSDRVLQIATLYQFGSEVLGDTKSFKEWVQSPLLALGGESPLSYMDSETGLSLINETLGRIAYGVYS